MNDRLLVKEINKIIPWSTQTNAKRPKKFMGETMPLFIERGKGIKCVSSDGREYDDYFCACGPIILGYSYARVNEAAKKAIDAGVVFSMASTMEYELAQKFVSLIPSLEWVRFMKTGNDATSAAVRIARAYTGKEKILQCGYHGWSDWYQSAAGARKAQGVPDFNSDYAVAFEYNNFEQVKKIVENDGNIAGIILTPFDWKTEPKDNFLNKLRELCTKCDIPLIFDEVLTGFRMGLRGAQGEFGVNADIVCYAKAISNGFPLSVIAGAKKFGDVWDKDKTLITTTYAGEIVSIAASLATLGELAEKNVNDSINMVGSHLKAGLEQIIKEEGLPIYITGRPALMRMFAATSNSPVDYDIQCKISRYYMSKGFFVREHGGVSYYLNYSHNEKDIGRLLDVSRAALKSGFEK